MSLISAALISGFAGIYPNTGNMTFYQKSLSGSNQDQTSVTGINLVNCRKIDPNIDILISLNLLFNAETGAFEIFSANNVTMPNLEDTILDAEGIKWIVKHIAYKALETIRVYTCIKYIN